MAEIEDLTDCWRETPGAVMLAHERQLLHDLARETFQRFGEATTIVNIGVGRGASLHCLYAGAPEARHVAVDIAPDNPPCVNREALEGVEFIQADSTIYAFEHPAHLVFVDGAHDYVTVKLDISNWTPHIPAGGIVAFHDYNPTPRDLERWGDQLSGARKAVREWYFDNLDSWTWVDVVGSIIYFVRVK